MAIELLLYHASFTKLSDLLEHFAGLLIEGQPGQNWSVESAGHMAVLCRPQGIIVEAESQGVVESTIADDLTCGDTIHRFSFNPLLTIDEETKVVNWLNNDAIGRPYNWLLLGQDVVLGIAHYLTYILGNPILSFLANCAPVDVLAGRAFICYQIAAGVANATGRPALANNPATLTPLTIWGWQKAGLLNYEGVLNGDPDAPAGGGPE